MVKTGSLIIKKRYSKPTIHSLFSLVWFGLVTYIILGFFALHLILNGFLYVQKLCDLYYPDALAQRIYLISPFEKMQKLTYRPTAVIFKLKSGVIKSVSHCFKNLCLF